MLTRLLSRLFPAAPVARSRFGVEPLEDRLTPNNRFVVPLTVTADNVTNFHSLAAALTTSGLTSGNVVEIEPASTPGDITNANVAAINAQNVTIRGAAGFAPSELPVVRTADAITVTWAANELTLQNLNLRLDYLLKFTANVAVRNSYIVVGATGNNGIDCYFTNHVDLRGNTIVDTGSTASRYLVGVDPYSTSINTIQGNTIVSSSASTTLLSYGGNPEFAYDVVSNNTFVRSVPFGSAGGPKMVSFAHGSWVTIRNNTFRDDRAENAALHIDGAVNAYVSDNVFALNYPAFSPGGAALELSGTAANGVLATIQGNSFATGPYGRAIDLAVNDATTFDVKLERNTFLENSAGVHITASSAAAAVSHIDLGGGGQGSLGGNNFRGFPGRASGTSVGAIIVDGGGINLSAQTVLAQGNLFGVADPETVIYDRADSGTQADVLATNAPTGNAAFVQALYARYLHRVGTLANPNDAGAWVNFMAAGGTQAQVANGIIRSQEALGYVVDDLYRTILGRDADDEGRSHHVNLLANGWTVEQVQMGLYGGAEYAVRFPGNAAYVANLFYTLLDRVPSAADLNAWLNLLPSLGRGGVAAGFINSVEYRNRVVKGLFFDMLKRTTGTAPTAQQVTSWVNTGLDVQSLRIAFAGTLEYYIYG